MRALKLEDLALRRGIVFAAFGFAAAVLAWRAFDLQMRNREFLQEHGDARYLRVVETEAHRGMITDRNGEPLAISTRVNSVWAKPTELMSNKEDWPRLAKLLDMNLEQLKEIIEPRKGREFLYLRRQVPPETAQRLEQAEIPGIGLVSEYRRYYPTVEVAAHLLGFTNVDDRGQEGVELAFDDTLRGTPGKSRVIKDRLGRIVEHVDNLRLVQPGRDLALSIDRRVQYVAYRELKRAVQKHGAQAGFIVILDVDTGEIVALVNQPSYNPNNRADLKGSQSRDRAVVDLFEPGSTIKAFTIAAALESGQYTPTTRVATEPGVFKLGRHIIRDVHNYGALDVSGVIEKSSNVGAAKIALSMEPELLWKMFTSVGFGQPTGVGLPGEAGGRLADYHNWREIEHATLAFGYGISVTGLQLTRAYAALAADGVIKPVSILKTTKAPEGVRVMSAKTAREVRDMLELVVTSGTAKAAAVPGYRVAGKTGTVHKLAADGYAEDDYLSLFAGYLPASAPKLVALVVIDNPQGGEYYGGLVAAPVFAAVMQDAARILNLTPDAYPADGDDRVRMAAWGDPQSAKIADTRR